MFLHGLVLILMVMGNVPTQADLSVEDEETEYKTSSIFGEHKNSIDPNDIHFNLYTTVNPSSAVRLFPGNASTTAIGTFLVGAPLKYILHDFDSLLGDSEAWTTEVKDAYMRTGIYNVILVDWSKLCHKSDLTVVANTYVVAKYGAQVLNGLSVTGVHAIGYGIGAHAASLTANLAGGVTISRITGLDPSKIVYGKFGDDYRLDSSDAPMVDVIHTNGGSIGFQEARGTADFYPNGGKIQPGCMLHGCSHMRATELFIESVNDRTAFSACRCNSYSEYKHKKCHCDVSAHMGESAGICAPGLYFLKTHSWSPFDKPYDKPCNHD